MSAIKHRVKEAGRKLFDGLLFDSLLKRPLRPGGQRGVSMKRSGKTRMFGGPKKRRTERTLTIFTSRRMAFVQSAKL